MVSGFSMKMAAFERRTALRRHFSFVPHGPVGSGTNLELQGTRTVVFSLRQGPGARLQPPPHARGRAQKPRSMVWDVLWGSEWLRCLRRPEGPRLTVPHARRPPRKSTSPPKKTAGHPPRPRDATAQQEGPAVPQYIAGLHLPSLAEHRRVTDEGGGGAPCTTQLRVGQPNSHNGMQGATCYPPGAADQKQ